MPENTSNIKMRNLDIDAFRPKPFYFITDASPAALSRSRVVKAMCDLKNAGYGGLIFFNKPPCGFSPEAFLGPEWFSTVRLFAETACTHGLEFWINDGVDFPPGDAGGRIYKAAPYLKQQRLSLSASGEVTVVDVPWGFPAFEESESSQLFIEFVYEEHKRHVGDLFGRAIAGFFSDADNRRIPHGLLNETYYPWYRNFEADFEQEFGYSIRPRLPGILRGKASQAACDYWLFVGNRYQAWFANNHEWCRKNGLKYTFHTSDSGPFTTEETIRSSIFAEGDPFTLHSCADLPGVDHELRTLNGGTTFQPGSLWFREHALWSEEKNCRSPQFHLVKGDVRAKLASSATFLFGREGTMCECFAATNWSAEPNDWRCIATWQIMQGINFIVPHAVHHNFGVVKYFAPPELMRCGALVETRRIVNHHIAWACACASQGSLVAPIALIEPSTYIWRDRRPCPLFFELCAKLNRLPHGYVIAPMRMLEDDAGRFKVVVNPGLDLSEEFCRKLEESGTILLAGQDLSGLDAGIGCDWTYSGSGSPHFMRRQLPEGEILLIANIEDASEIEGDLRYREQSWSLVLAPGEMAFFSPLECNFRKPRKIVRKMLLPEEAFVDWHAPNVVAIARWEDREGNVLLPSARTAAPASHFFRWINQDALNDLLLRLPQNPLAAFIDGVAIPKFKRIKRFDEYCFTALLPNSGLPGAHVLEVRFDKLQMAPTSSFFEISYLEGDFDCEVNHGQEVEPKASCGYFNFTLDMPRYAQISLSRPRRTLSMKRSWAGQGRPFYSGKADYKLHFEIPAGFSHPVLRFGEVHCQLELKINGRSMGVKAFPPYDFDLVGLTGLVDGEAEVENTPGNVFDAYGAPSGLTSVPELMDIEE